MTLSFGYENKDQRHKLRNVPIRDAHFLCSWLKLISSEDDFASLLIFCEAIKEKLCKLKLKE